MATELNYFFPLIELGRALKPPHHGFFFLKIFFYFLWGWVGGGASGVRVFRSLVVLEYLAGLWVAESKTWALNFERQCLDLNQVKEAELRCFKR